MKKPVFVKNPKNQFFQFFGPIGPVFDPSGTISDKSMSLLVRQELGGVVNFKCKTTCDGDCLVCTLMEGMSRLLLVNLGFLGFSQKLVFSLF